MALAKSLEVLRNQINKRYPNRDKSSDGTFPSPQHMKQNPRSDHNVGDALDITHDPEHGVDAGNIANQLRLSRDFRIKYIISNKRIASSKDNWAWRKYTGQNPHDHHFHVSVIHNVRDITTPWDFIPKEAEKPEPPPVVTKTEKGLIATAATTAGGVVADKVVNAPAPVAPAPPVPPIRETISTVTETVNSAGEVARTIPDGGLGKVLAFVSQPIVLAVILTAIVVGFGVTMFIRWKHNREVNE